MHVDIEKYCGSRKLIYIAAGKGHLDIVKLSLEHGATINEQAGHYCTPLQAASNRGQLEVVKFLRRNGADPHIEGGEMSNALTAALSKSTRDGDVYDEIAQLLMARSVVPADMDIYLFFGIAQMVTSTMLTCRGIRSSTDDSESDPESIGLDYRRSQLLTSSTVVVRPSQLSGSEPLRFSLHASQK